MKYDKKKIASWVLAVVAAGILLQTLPFKFTGAPETQYIFETIGAWMDTNFLAFMGGFFAASGGYLVGSLELIASIATLVPKTRAYGAIGIAVLMTGALFFHLFTPLGVNVNGDGGALFIMAIVAWGSSLGLAYLHRDQLPSKA